jgi:hypothetical protein
MINAKTSGSAHCGQDKSYQTGQLFAEFSISLIDGTPINWMPFFWTMPEPTPTLTPSPTPVDKNAWVVSKAE